jgi:hypothetical protein
MIARFNEEIRRKPWIENIDFMNKYFVTILFLLICGHSSAQAEPRECSWDEVVSGYGYSDILYSSLPQKIIESVRWYGGTGGYKEVNSYLRGLTSPRFFKKHKLTKHIDKLDSAIENFSFPLDCFLYRGMNLGFRGNKPFETGEFISDNGFQSTSVKRTIADRTFARKTDTQNISSLLVIYNNFNQKSLLIGNGEAEVLLPRNSLFKIMKSIVVGGKNYVLAFRCEDRMCEAASLPTDLPEPFILD